MCLTQCWMDLSAKHMMILTVTRKKVHFPTLNLTFLSIILQSRWVDSNRNKMLQNFSNPSLHSEKQQSIKLRSVDPLIPNPVKTSKLNQRVLCSVCLPTVCLTCQRQQCLLQCRPARPSPSSETLCKAYQSAHSFVKRHTHTFYDWRAAINTPPPKYGCW